MIRERAVVRAALVPDRHVEGLPAPAALRVRVVEARAQEREQHLALLGVHADDPAYVRAAQVERRTSGHRVDPHQRVAGALEAVGDAPVDLRPPQPRRRGLEVRPGVQVLLEVFARQPKLVIFGGVHVAQALTMLARPLGYRTFVADGREAWLTRERFPHADELVLGWPADAFARIGLDENTSVVLLSHDPKFDEPALEIALRSPAAYVGAIGSRKTQEKRRAHLREQGFTDDQVARLHGPIGLDLGGRHPMETALSILAEIAAVRNGATGRSLSASQVV